MRCKCWGRVREEWKHASACNVSICLPILQQIQSKSGPAVKFSGDSRDFWYNWSFGVQNLIIADVFSGLCFAQAFQWCCHLFPFGWFFEQFCGLKFLLSVSQQGFYCILVNTVLTRESFLNRLLKAAITAFRFVLIPFICIFFFFV